MSDFNIDFSTSKVNYINDFSEDWKVNLIDTGKNTMTGGRLLKLKNTREKDVHVNLWRWCFKYKN